MILRTENRWLGSRPRVVLHDERATRMRSSPTLFREILRAKEALRDDRSLGAFMKQATKTHGNYELLTSR